MITNKAFSPPRRQDAKKTKNFFRHTKEPETLFGRFRFFQIQKTFLASWRLGGKFFFIFFIFYFDSPLFAQTPELKTKSYFPSVLLCEKKRNVLAHDTHGKLDWEYTLDGPLFDVQPQSLSGRYLVTGGTGKVFLLRKVWKGCRVLWDWSKLDGLSIQSAVAVDWSPNGEPSLILAADTQNQKLFLAEAKSNGVKIRWEYKLPAPPRTVHVCPDTGNFLVTLQDSTVEEIFFQEDKVAWSLGKENGLKDVRDAVRNPWAQTFVADASGGLILCFDPGKNILWKTRLPFTGDHAFEEMALSLYKKNGKRMVMASVHLSPGGGPGARDILYLLNAETGKVIAWSDRPEKGDYPALLKAVPDIAVYQKKE